MGIELEEKVPMEVIIINLIGVATMKKIFRGIKFAGRLIAGPRYNYFGISANMPSELSYIGASDFISPVYTSSFSRHRNRASSALESREKEYGVKGSMKSISALFLLLSGLFIISCVGGGNSSDGVERLSLTTLESELGISDFTFVPSKDAIAIGWKNPANNILNIAQFNITLNGWTDSSGTTLGYTKSILVSYDGDNTLQNFSFTGLIPDFHYDISFQVVYMNNRTSRTVAALRGMDEGVPLRMLGVNTDGDGLADEEDPDDDNDGRPDTSDNCPLLLGGNTNQADNDNDGFDADARANANKGGDICDADDDNDEIPDTSDNCPLVANPDQADNDGDYDPNDRANPRKGGDACDIDDDDGDGGGFVATLLSTFGISNFTFTPSPASITLNWTNPTNSSRAISQFNISIAGYSSKSASTAEYSDHRLFDYGGDGMTQTASFANLDAALHYEILLQAIYTDGTSTDAINALAGALFPRRAIGVNTDGDGFADTDDIDDDDDGRPDTSDNCPILLGGNTNQADNDNDGFAADARTNANKGGDICDIDDDNDGRLDTSDNCPLVANPDQADTDGDYDPNDRANPRKGGDACDIDDDNDGRPDGPDINISNFSNFTFTPSATSITLSWTNPANPPRAISQFNISIAGYSSKSASTAEYSDHRLVDYGGIGTRQIAFFANLDDALHYEVLLQAIYIDNSSSSAIDALAGTLFPRRALGVNTDGDGFADEEDPDDDNDGRLDTIDNCPLLLGGNANQADNDNDGFAADARTNANKGGDICDIDDDNDNIVDTRDNCPLIANDGQSNNDGDSVGNACDVDADGDGLIEISTATEFDMIRHNLAGTNLTSTMGGDGDASGCVRVASDRDPCHGYELTADISLASYPNWVSIGTCTSNNDCPINTSFSGVFDGNNHSISNLTIDISSESYGVGLFGSITSAAILRNLILVNVNIESNSSGSDFGSLVGYGRGASILDVRAVNVTIGAANVGDVGGLLGDGESSTVSSSSVVAHSISGPFNVGGLLGWGRSSTVSSSSVVADSISGSSFNVGGLLGVGWSATISSSSVDAHSINGSDFVGGLLGDGERARVSSSSVVADSISGSSSEVGGLIGYGWSSTVSSSSVVADSISGSEEVGGLLGYGESSTVSSSSVVADSISGSSIYVGGLLGDGWGSTVSSSSVVADSISGRDFVGGLLGWGESSTVSSSLVLGGSLNGTSHVGGIVGASGVINNVNSDPRDVSNSYWSIVFTAAQPLPTNTFGESKSVSEIQSPTTFTGIYADWDNAWCDPVTGEFTTSPTHSLATAGGGDTYRAWDLGNSMQYPAMTCFGDRLTPAQQRNATTRVLGGDGGGSVATLPTTLGISNFTFTPAPDSITLSWTNPTNPPRAISEFNISIAGYSSKSASTAVYSNSRLFDYEGDGTRQEETFNNLNPSLHYEVLLQAIYMDNSKSTPVSALGGTIIERRALGVNTDGDGFADADDIDDDNDGRLDTIDNCPLVANHDQADTDGDYDPNDRANANKGGDICDADDDNDEIPDTIDNCPLLLGGNTNQADNDGDYDPNDRANANKGGDICDADDDNDGTADTADVDSDGDGLIEISTYEQFNMIRHNLAGTNLTSTAGGDGDTSGCYSVASGGTPCHGYELTADISLASSSYPNWTPIGTCVANNYCPNSFSGVFDGNNHSISNLIIDISSESYGVGLFGSIAPAAILRNLILMNVNISSTSSGSNFGSLVGYGRGASILDVRAVNVTIGASGVGDVGGLLGDGESSTVSSSSVVAHSISGSDNVGGLLGDGEFSTVSSSSVDAHSISGSNNVGGLLGDGEFSTVSSSSVDAHSISGSSRVGGLLGDGERARVSSSSVDAHSISGSSFVGGLLGDGWSSTVSSSSVVAHGISGSSRVGGLLGDGNSAIVSSSSVVAHSISGSSDVGGLVGWGESSTVSSSSVVAHSISASGDYVGGLLGWGASSTISSSLVLGGSLNGASHVGGIVGASGVIFGANSNPRDVSNSYWSIVFTDAQPATTNIFGESKSKSEIQSPTTFTGIYADWANGWCDPATGEFTTSPTHRLATAGGGDTYRAWDLGNSMQYPAMTCFGNKLTPAQQRAATTKVLNVESPLPLSP